MAMQDNLYGSFADAYRGGLRQLLLDGRRTEPILDARSIGSRFGTQPRSGLEITGYAATITKPDALIIVSPERRARLFVSVGLWVWTLAGSNLVEAISYYNGRAVAFSDDGSTLGGSFGTRLFDDQLARPSQLDRVVTCLREDPASRRAVAAIFQPSDLMSDSRDVPCAIAVQYLVREGKLEAVTYMRSQSAAMVLVYDIFVFAALQRWVAAALDVALGPHHLLVGSYHVYEDEVDLSHRISVGPIGATTMSDMLGTPTATEELIQFEREVRLASLDGRLDRLIEMSADMKPRDSFESESEVILISHAFARLGEMEHARSMLAQLNPPLRYVALADWQDRLP
jgi:thymidylate synthase